MTIGVRNLRSEKSALKWLIVVGLLWSQFAYAGHQLTHGADEIGERCQICTGYDHFEDALSDAVCAATIPVAASVLPTRFAVLEAAERLRAYSARASPLSPDSSF